MSVFGSDLSVCPIVRNRRQEKCNLFGLFPSLLMSLGQDQQQHPVAGIFLLHTGGVSRGGSVAVVQKSCLIFNTLVNGARHTNENPLPELLLLLGLCRLHLLPCQSPSLHKSLLHSGGAPGFLRWGRGGVLYCIVFSRFVLGQI